MVEMKQVIANGDLFMVDFNEGGLQGKRPCAIVEVNEETVKVCPLTTNIKMRREHPTLLQLTPNEVNRLKVASTVVGGQVREIQQTLLQFKIGQLTKEECDQLLQIVQAQPQA